MKTLGLVFVILVNIIYVAQNYLVKTVELGAGEVSLVRGLLQILVFSVVMFATKNPDTNSENNKNEKLESGEMLLRKKCKTLNEGRGGPGFSLL